MDFAHWLAGRGGPPAFFGEADSMFAGDDAAPGENLRKQIIERALHAFANGDLAIIAIRHDVDVNVSITGMAKAGDRKSGFCAQSLRKLDKIDDAAPRHDDVLIQFGQSGGAEGIAKLPAQGPQFFTILFASR